MEWPLLKACNPNSQVLQPLKEDMLMLLYLTIEIAMGMMLAYENKGKAMVIYYFNQKILNYKVRYIQIEKSCLALIWLPKTLHA